MTCAWSSDGGAEPAATSAGRRSEQLSDWQTGAMEPVTGADAGERGGHAGRRGSYGIDGGAAWVMTDSAGINRRNR